MAFILDIDLDYFPLFEEPVCRLDEVLEWAERPVDFIVDEHHKVMKPWVAAIKNNVIETPTFVLHVDEHHDMLSEHRPVQSGNFIYFVLRRWKNCHVHWLTTAPIDYPDAWLSDEAWQSVRARFSSGSRLNATWPKPDLVSVCTSPGFVESSLARRLLERIAHLGYWPNAWPEESQLKVAPMPAPDMTKPELRKLGNR